MSKKILLIVGAVAVIAFGYFGVWGYPPVEKGAEGTVGAAKRYEAEQISSKDVVLQNPALQEFMQTDVFQSLTSNKEAVKVLGSEGMKQALANQSFRDMLASQSMRDALANKDFRDRLADQSLRDALANKDFREALANKDFRDKLADQSSRDKLAQ